MVPDRPFHILEGLTGAIRYRKHRRLFGHPLIVLQVEERIAVYKRPPSPYGGDEPIRRYTDWRDASVSDVSEILKLTNKSLMEAGHVAG